MVHSVQGDSEFQAFKDVWNAIPLKYSLPEDWEIPEDDKKDMERWAAADRISKFGAQILHTIQQQPEDPSVADGSSPQASSPDEVSEGSPKN